MSKNNPAFAEDPTLYSWWTSG